MPKLPAGPRYSTWVCMSRVYYASSGGNHGVDDLSAGRRGVSQELEVYTVYYRNAVRSRDATRGRTIQDTFGQRPESFALRLTCFIPDRWVSQEASTLSQHVVVRCNGMPHLAITDQASSRCFLPYVRPPPRKTDIQPHTHVSAAARH